MGTYRFILSILVLISHLGINIKGYNPGVSAVISFYLLSGYVMTGLIINYYASTEKIKFFYIDRVCRLFPQFIFYTTLTLLSYLIFKFENNFLTNLSILNISLNYLMIPQGYYMFNNLSNALIIPQSWSLGLELTFYIIIPFILIKNLNRKISAISLVFFILAFFGFINTDYYGYRLIPGTIFIFLLGSWVYSKKKLNRLNIFLYFFTSFILYLSLFYSKKLSALPYNKEVLLGILIGLPILLFLNKINIRNRFDDFLGNLSYGVFLNHFLLIFFFEKFSNQPIYSHNNTIKIIFLSVIFSIFSYFYIEKPFISLRRKYRISQ